MAALNEFLRTSGRTDRRNGTDKRWSVWGTARGLPPRRRLFPALGTFSALVLVTLFAGCEGRDPGDGGEVADTTASYDLTFPDPTFAAGRTLDTLFSVDLDDDGRREYVVTSLAKEAMTAPGARADLVEIYRFDTISRSWQVVLSDTLFWGTGYRLREMTGDRAPEIIADVFGGGNDPIASNGMRIYSGDGGKIRTILSADDGNPEIRMLEGMNTPVVILHDLIWPPLVPHVQSVPYISDLLAFNGTAMASVRDRHADYFKRQADTLLARYAEGLKSARAPVAETIGENGLADADLPDGSLFALAAQAIIALDQAGEVSTLRNFWNRERDTLQAVLPAEQYDQLGELYAEKIMR